MLVSLAVRVLGVGLAVVARLVVRVLEVGFPFTMGHSIEKGFVQCNKNLVSLFLPAVLGLLRDKKYLKTRR
jgi:hypothetical protein